MYVCTYMCIAPRTIMVVNMFFIYFLFIFCSFSFFLYSEYFVSPGILDFFFLFLLLFALSFPFFFFYTHTHSYIFSPKYFSSSSCDFFFLSFFLGGGGRKVGGCARFSFFPQQTILSLILLNFFSFESLLIWCPRVSCIHFYLHL